MLPENYLIINNKESNNNICYVFCSSNGLFWNSRDEKYVLENDYFEFKNIANDKRIKGCKKIIFLRDMDTSFYVNGINKDIDSITKIISFIENETRGLDLVFVGISAGGYLANLLGLFLPNTKKVFGVGTIFNIREWNGRHSYSESKYLIDNETNKEKSIYYNLYPILKERLKTTSAKFYYLYGSKNKYDVEIASETKKHISDDKFVYIPIKSVDHGVRLSYNSFVSLLTTKKEIAPKRKPYSKIGFTIHLIGFRKALYCLMLDLKYKVFRKRDIFKKAFNKINRYFQIKKALKYAKHLLADGYYVVDNRLIKQSENNKRVFLRTYKIKCKYKKINPVNSLYFVTTKYKNIFVSDEKAFFYVKSKKRYKSFEQRYFEYGKNLPYKHINMDFSVKEKLVVSDTAKGTKCKNHERFNDVVQLILDVSKNSKTIIKDLFINNKKCPIPFCIQHGDFKDSNIIWNGTEYLMIDLEEIGEYPMLFDLFFYIFISKPTSFKDIIFSYSFVKSIKDVWRLNSELSFDNDYMFVDYSVAVYLSFLLKMYKKEHTKEFFDYYMFWVSSSFLNDKRLSLTKLIIDTELANDKLFQKRKKQK